MERITPLRAIRLKCLDCMGEQYNAVKSCPCVDCSLWKFRLGIHPFTKKNSKNPLLDANYSTGGDSE